MASLDLNLKLHKILEKQFYPFLAASLAPRHNIMQNNNGGLCLKHWRAQLVSLHHRIPANPPAINDADIKFSIFPQQILLGGGAQRSGTQVLARAFIAFCLDVWRRLSTIHIVLYTHIKMSAKSAQVPSAAIRQVLRFLHSEPALQSLLQA